MFFAFARILAIAAVFFAAGALIINHDWLFSWLQENQPDLIYQQEPLTSTQIIALDIGWKDLLPESERDTLAAVSATQSLSMANRQLDEFASQVFSTLEAAGDPAYQAALTSTNTTSEYSDRIIRIPGFVVPLSVADGRKIQQFFLVPYFGACLHYPPPPPNQMIFVNAPEPFAMPSLFNPVVIQGKLNVGMFEDLLGTSAYLLDLQQMEAYSGEPDDVRSHN